MRGRWEEGERLERWKERKGRVGGGGGPCGPFIDGDNITQEVLYSYHQQKSISAGGCLSGLLAKITISLLAIYVTQPFAKIDFCWRFLAPRPSLQFRRRSVHRAASEKNIKEYSAAMKYQFCSSV